MRELVFEVTQEADGGFVAECLTDTIVTEGESWEQLRENVREVVKAFHFDRPRRAADKHSVALGQRRSAGLCMKLPRNVKGSDPSYPVKACCYVACAKYIKFCWR